MIVAFARCPIKWIGLRAGRIFHRPTSGRCAARIQRFGRNSCRLRVDPVGCSILALRRLTPPIAEEFPKIAFSRFGAANSLSAIGLQIIKFGLWHLPEFTLPVAHSPQLASARNPCASMRSHLGPRPPTLNIRVSWLILGRPVLLPDHVNAGQVIHRERRLFLIGRRGH